MTPGEKPEFVRVIVGLAALKPGKPLTDAGIDLFWNSMQHWDMQEFRLAAQHLARAVEFMPNPFHFEQLRKAALPTARELWTRVTLLVQMAEHVRAAELAANPLPDAAVRAVVAMGGWRQLEMGETSTRHFREKRFAELLQEQGEADESRMALPSSSHRLTGPRPAALLLAKVDR